MTTQRVWPSELRYQETRARLVQMRNILHVLAHAKPGPHAIPIKLTDFAAGLEWWLTDFLHDGGAKEGRND